MGQTVANMIVSENLQPKLSHHEQSRIAFNIMMCCLKYMIILYRSLCVGDESSASQ